MFQVFPYHLNVNAIIIIMQMKHTKNLNPKRSELGTTLELAELVSWRSVDVSVH